MARLEKVRSRLAKIQCGPHPRSDHNIGDVDAHVFAPVVLSVMLECTRILQNLTPSVHRPNLIVPEVDLQEASAIPLAAAVGHMAAFRLNHETPVMAQRFEDPPDFAAPPFRFDPVSDSLLIKGLFRKCRRGPKRSGARLEKRRPPPEWDATRPPVHHIDMVLRGENIIAPRVFLLLPDPFYSHPYGFRWRYYAHLHGRPFFSIAEGMTLETMPRRYFR